jgi:SusD family.
MEKRIKNIKKLGLLGLLGLVGMMQTSCTDFLQIEPQNEIILEKFWTDKDDVHSIITGCYSALQSDANVKRMMVWGEFRSDNIYVGENINSDGDLEKVLVENIDAKNDYTNWDGFYDVINRCNTVIKYAPGVAEKDPAYTQSELKADIAEVTALRSLCYFYLIRTFRDVPYSSEAYIDDSQKMDLPATKFEDVLDSLIYSLEAVRGDAVRRYPETTPLYQTGRITRDAISAMLCEMYLWKQDYDNCIKYADLVIASKKEIAEENRKLSSNYSSSGGAELYELTNGYPLIPSQITGKNFGNAYETIFGSDDNARRNAQEIIFQLVFNDNPQGSGMKANGAVNSFYGNGTSKIGLVAPSEFLLEERDVEVSQRKVFSKSNKKMDARLYENFNTDDKYIHKYTTDDITIEAQSATPRARYSSRYAQGQNGSNWIIYRLSDIMLLKAEALTQKLREGAEEDDISYNKSIIDEAFTLINAVNKRSVCEPLAQLVDTLQRNDYNTKELVTTLLYQERQRELMFEGKRWYDLVRISRRTGKTDDLSTAALRKAQTSSDLIGNKLSKMDAIYWPYNYEEVKVNKNLVQNPAFDSGENKSYEKNY